MRKLLTLLVIGLAIVLASNVSSADAELNADLMQRIEDTNKSLASNLSLKNAKASTADARALAAMFADVESFFVKKEHAENAAKLAKTSKDLSTEIVNSLAMNNFAIATDAATNLSRTCRACHTFYKNE